jgi:hypothetical protein
MKYNWLFLSLKYIANSFALFRQYSKRRKLRVWGMQLILQSFYTVTQADNNIPNYKGYIDLHASPVKQTHVYQDMAGLTALYHSSDIGKIHPELEVSDPFRFIF